jgi:hypothetical protein
MMRLTLTPVTHSIKLIAAGAVSFYVNHLVTKRITQFTYGVSSSILYQPFNPEHVKREQKSYLDAAGNKYIPGHFKIILPRVRHLSPFIHPPRKSRYIAGYGGPGGPGSAVQLHLCNRRCSTATGRPVNYQIHWHAQYPGVD